MNNQDKIYNVSLDSEEELVMKIVAGHFGKLAPTLSLDTGLADDLGADSLDKLELIMTVEEVFDVKIPDDELSAVLRIGDIADAVKRAKVRTRQSVENVRKE